MRFRLFRVTPTPWRCAFARAFSEAASILLIVAAVIAISASAALPQASLAGRYDGHQMEMAAALELEASGRFRYALAYGALDEEAAGTWTQRGNQVLLSSDPVAPPRFVLLSQGRGGNNLLRIDLDVPHGMSRQYFDAVVTTAKGRTARKQFAEDGLVWPFSPGDPPTGVRIALQMFQVASQPLRLDPNAGYALRFRFEPNDLGKVNFQAAPLSIVNGNLVLERHGRTITFRRVQQ
jgi:hypothetical protein